MQHIHNTTSLYYLHSTSSRIVKMLSHTLKPSLPAFSGWLSMWKVSWHWRGLRESSYILCNYCLVKMHSDISSRATSPFSTGQIRDWLCVDGKSAFLKLLIGTQSWLIGWCSLKGKHLSIMWSLFVYAFTRRVIWYYRIQLICDFLPL